MTTDIQKAAILHMRGQGMSYPEIAGTLAMSANTVKSICRRNAAAEQTARDAPAVCKNCGQPLIQPPGVKRKTFCSDQCRYAWWNKARHKQPYQLICHYCGKEFISYGNRKRKFCGRDCYRLSRQGEGLP